MQNRSYSRKDYNNFEGMFQKALGQKNMHEQRCVSIENNRFWWPTFKKWRKHLRVPVHEIILK